MFLLFNGCMCEVFLTFLFYFLLFVLNMIFHLYTFYTASMHVSSLFLVTVTEKLFCSCSFCPFGVFLVISGAWCTKGPWVVYPSHPHQWRPALRWSVLITDHVWTHYCLFVCYTERTFDNNDQMMTLNTASPSLIPHQARINSLIFSDVHTGFELRGAL